MKEFEIKGYEEREIYYTVKAKNEKEAKEKVIQGKWEDYEYGDSHEELEDLEVLK